MAWYLGWGSIPSEATPYGVFKRHGNEFTPPMTHTINIIPERNLICGLQIMFLKVKV